MLYLAIIIQFEEDGVLEWADEKWKFLKKEDLVPDDDWTKEEKERL